jgi:hypothetical protein
MCGTALEGHPSAVTGAPVSVADRLRALTEDEPKARGNNSESRTEPRRTAVPSFLGLDDAPRKPARSSNGISGPSFLGLDTPPERASCLLDDEEPRSHWRGYLVALLILVVAVLAALQWRTEVKAQAYKVGTILWARMHATPTQPNVNEKVAGGPPPDTPTPTPQNTSPPAPAPAETSPSANSPSAPQSAPQALANESASPAAPSPSTPDAGKLGPAQTPEQQTSPARTKAAESASLAASRKPASPNDQQRADALLLMAQKYLHGLGVPRDCEQGLVYLREAVRQPNAPARSQMGALYATGTCVPQNRVEAYRWFSSAMEVEPTNTWLGRERDTLYGEMTAAERQQLSH